MGIQQLLNLADSSIFRESTYSSVLDSQKGAYSISIIPNEAYPKEIKGLMKEGLSFSMNPNWDVLGLASAASNFRWLSNIIDWAAAPLAASGTTINNTGLLTEKFFSKSSYLEISPSFRVVDWEGNGEVIIVLALLLNLCVPKKGYEDNISNVAKQLLELGDDQLSKIFKDPVTGAIYERVKDFVNGLTEAGKATIDAAPEYIGEPYRRGEDAIGGGTFGITKSPPSVTVRIGNYFEYDEMILESLDVQLSLQSTKKGPLYGDFSLKLSSKTMPTVDTMGMTFKSGRVIDENTDHENIMITDDRYGSRIG